MRGEEPDLWIPLLGEFQSSGGLHSRQITVCYAIHFYRRGSGKIEIDGMEHRIGAGDILAYFPEQLIERWDSPKDPWEYSWVRLEGRKPRQALALIGFTEENPLMRRDLFAEMDPLFKRIREVYAHGNEPHPLFPIIAAWRALEPFTTANVDNISEHIDDLPSAALRLIEAHYADDLTIDEIADRFRVDRSTLYRRFKSTYGLSPKQALDQFRLARAAELLGSGQACVQDAATACGFNSAHYFSRAFRKRYGMAPSAWKGTGGRAL